MWRIDVELVEEWLTALDQSSYEQVVAALELLAERERRAILLVAGDKAGNWTKWYRVNVPIADDRFTEHLDALPRKGL